MRNLVMLLLCSSMLSCLVDTGDKSSEMKGRPSGRNHEGKQSIGTAVQQFDEL